MKELAVSEAQIAAKKEAKDNMLVLSKFLRAAAAKRQSGDETSDENRAFEGALLLVYGGDAGAVSAMEKLIEGSDEKVPAVDQEPLDFNCKFVEFFVRYFLSILCFCRRITANQSMDRQRSQRLCS